MKRMVAATVIVVLALTLASCSLNDMSSAMRTTEVTDASNADVVSEGEENGYKYIEYTDHIELTDCTLKETGISLPTIINGKPVTSFGQIFRSSITLSSIRIPDTYKAIDSRAFSECYKLQRVIIMEDGVSSIGSMAFFGCQSLKIMEVPETVTDVAVDAFKYCTDLFIYGNSGSAVEKVADQYQSIYFRVSGGAEKETSENSTEEVTSEESTVENDGASTADTEN